VFLNDVDDGCGGGTKFYCNEATAHLVKVNLTGKAIMIMMLLLLMMVHYNRHDDEIVVAMIMLMNAS
jgi:hypothetical protein